jgi:hypothetical protein
MKDRSTPQRSQLFVLSAACLVLTTLGCTNSDSDRADGASAAGPDAGNKDGATCQSGGPGTSRCDAPPASADTGDSAGTACSYPAESSLSDAGETLWSWYFRWTSAIPDLVTMCAAWGADAKMILEVMVPASNTGTGTTLPTCTTDAIATGSGPACSVANSRRFEAACSDGHLLFALPSQNTIDAFYHIESSNYPNSRRWTVLQAVEGCVRNVIGVPGAPEQSPRDAAADLGIDAGGTSTSEVGGTSTSEAGGTPTSEVGGTSTSEAGGTSKGEAGSEVPDGAGCGAGTLVHYATPGCGAEATPTCVSVGDSGYSPSSYCACDGTTTLTYDARGVRSPYLYPGPCRRDGGVDSGSTDARPANDLADAGNPCAACAADQVCVQSFDGICHTSGVACRTVSAACRTKLIASGSKSCAALSECQSEFCSSPYQCVINSPCGTEVAQAALYCYGP